MEPLTYTEEQILAYIREGRFDAEIAVRLGITNGDVQRRIAATCRKLGLPDRAALRSSTVIPTVTPTNFAPEVVGAEPVRPRPSRASVSALITGGLATLLVVAGAAWFALGRSEQPAAEIQQPAAPPPWEMNDLPPWMGGEPRLVPGQWMGGALALTPVPPPPSVTEVDGVAVTMMTEGPVARLPLATEMLYLAKGGPGDRRVALMRAIRTDTQIAVPATSTIFAPPDGFEIVDVLANSDGSDIILALGTAADDGVKLYEVRFLRSHDYGVTWTLIGTRVFPRTAPADPRAASLAAFEGDDVIIAVHIGQDVRYVQLNGGKTVEQDGEHAVPWTDTSWARVTNLEGFLGIYDLSGELQTVVNSGRRSIMSVNSWPEPGVAIATFSESGTLSPVLFLTDTGQVMKILWPQDDTVFQEVVAVRKLGDGESVARGTLVPAGPRIVRSPFATVRIYPTEQCAPIYQAAGANEPQVGCLADLTVVGVATNTLGDASTGLWRAVFPVEACDSARGCTGTALGFIRDELLELGG